MKFKDELEDCHFWNMVDSIGALLDRLESYRSLIRETEPGKIGIDLDYARNLYDTQIKPEIRRLSKNVQWLLDCIEDPVINTNFTKEDKNALIKATRKCTWSRWS